MRPWNGFWLSTARPPWPVSNPPAWCPCRFGAAPPSPGSWPGWGQSWPLHHPSLSPVCLQKPPAAFGVSHEPAPGTPVQPGTSCLLRKYGYADPSNLRRALAHLRRNFSPPGGFPHEIGVFLGYPLEDVRGFIAGGGEGCKLCGYWKVYGDVERARQSFARYDRCRAALCARIDQGKRLPDIFCRPRNLQRRTFIS